MFTGLIEEIGTVVAAEAASGGQTLTVAARRVLEDLKPGDSIAVDGACLTVTTLGAGSFTAGLSPETLRRTALGELRQGACVQLERALLPGSRLGGHYVQGHIDGTATILETRAEGEALWMKFRAPRELMPYLAPKGYVAIDGASLTIVHTGEDWFDVQFVAWSRGKLALPAKPPSARVNLEVDILAKYAERRERLRGTRALPQVEAMPPPGLASVPEALAEIRAGHFVVVVDDESRENEGDLVMAAEFVTSEALNFCISEGRGLVCCAMSSDLVDRFGLPPMVPESENGSRHGTAFTVSVDAAAGVTTGISAADRARTIRTLIDPDATSAGLVSPGHVFPLRARAGGVLERAGHTEASVEIAILAGLAPAAMICEILNEDGSMARLRDLEAFALRHGLRIVSVEAIAQFRRASQQPQSRRATG
jgi:3,4-dihydroxy 2-butanone 4-phosphate synthase/3,4-dihydroxy 2-butanone 4-phosphate synthase/GTP cyclohydrolase II